MYSSQMDVSSPLSESDDSMSESTRVFNLKMEKDFMKAFPLRPVSFIYFKISIAVFRSQQNTLMGPPSSAVKGNPGT